ncbi:MAG: hypothetical protein ACP6IP_09855 [Candidatus Njordarchaeia archaeon]
MVDLETTAACLKHIMDKLSISNLTTFQLEKFVYLIQEWGINLGFRYGWFIYNPLRFEGPYTIGPYSTQLLYYEDDIREILDSNENLKKLNEDQKKRLNSLVSLVNLLLDSFKGTRRTLEYVLELISTLHFTFKYSGMPREKNAIISRIIEVKPELRREDLAWLWELLAKAGLI